MAEPENHTLRLLRDLCQVMEKLDQNIDRLERKADRNHEELRSRLDIIRQAINGESVLGRYAAAEVEERLGAIETRLSALEKAR